MADTIKGKLVIDTQVQIDSARKQLSDLQKYLDKLTIPSNLKDRFTTTFSSLNKEFSKLETRIQGSLKTKGDLSGIEKTTQAIERLYENLANLITKTGNIGDGIFGKIQTAEIDNLDAKIKQISETLKNFTNVPSLQKLKTDFENSATASDTLKTKVEAFVQAFKAGDFSGAEKIRNEIAKTAKGYQTIKDNTDKVTEKQQAWINALDSVDKATQEYNNTVSTLNQQLSNLTGQRSQAVEDALNKQRNGFEQVSQSVKNGNTVLQQNNNTLIESVRSMVSFETQAQSVASSLTRIFSVTGAITAFRKIVRDAFNDVKELDEAMTSIAVVTDFSISDLWRQVDEYSKLAQEKGVELKGVYDVQKLYYQQGRSAEDVKILTNNTLEFARIAEMDYAAATDAMTVAINAFNLKAEESIKITDIYSNLAAKAAVDQSELANAMSKVASMAASVGMSLETTSTFLTQIIETTREAPETAGTALKTVLARFGEVKKLIDTGKSTGTTDEGEEIDVNKIDTALKTVGVRLTDTNGQMRALDKVIIELAEKWNGLDSMTQRYLATMAAGSRQQSRFLALMSNSERLTELLGEAYNSAGAGAAQFAKTQESLQSKINNLKTAWTQFTTSVLDSKLLKGAVDTLTLLLNTVNALTDALGPLSGAAKIAAIFFTLIGGGQKIEKLFSGKLASGLVKAGELFRTGKINGEEYQAGFESGRKTRKTASQVAEELEAAEQGLREFKAKEAAVEAAQAEVDAARHLKEIYDANNFGTEAGTIEGNAKATAAYTAEQIEEIKLQKLRMAQEAAYGTEEGTARAQAVEAARQAYENLSLPARMVLAFKKGYQEGTNWGAGFKAAFDVLKASAIFQPLVMAAAAAGAMAIYYYNSAAHKAEVAHKKLEEAISKIKQYESEIDELENKRQSAEGLTSAEKERLDYLKTVLALQKEIAKTAAVNEQKETDKANWSETKGEGFLGKIIQPTAFTLSTGLSGSREEVTNEALDRIHNWEQLITEAETDIQKILSDPLRTAEQKSYDIDVKEGNIEAYKDQIAKYRSELANILYSYTNDSGLAPEEYLDEKQLENYNKLKEYLQDITEEAESASESLGKMNKVQGYKDAAAELKSIKTSVSAITDAISGIYKDGYADIEKISTIANNEAFADLDSFPEFLDLISKAGKEDIPQLEDAMENLLDEYMASDGVLSSLNETTKGMYINALNNMGVINAQEVVEAKLQQAKAQTLVLSLEENKINSLLTGSTEQVSKKLEELAQKYGTTSQAIAAFLIKQKFATNNPLSTAKSRAELEKLIKSLDKTGKAYSTYIKYTTLIDRQLSEASKYGKLASDAEIADDEKLQTYYENLAKQSRANAKANADALEKALNREIDGIINVETTVNTTNLNKTSSKTEKEIQKLSELYNAKKRVAELDEQISDLEEARKTLTDYDERLANENAIVKAYRQQKVGLEELIKVNEALRARKEAEGKATAQWSDFYTIDKITKELKLTDIYYKAIKKGTAENKKYSVDVLNNFKKWAEEYDDIVDFGREEQNNLDKIKTTLDELWKDYRSNYIDLVNELAQYYEEAQQKIIDDQKDAYDKMKELDDNYLDELRKNIEARRAARDRENDVEDITKKQKRLAMLMRDTSGRNAGEIADLQKEIQDAQQNLIDDDVDRVLDSIEDANDKQQENWDNAIDVLEKQLEADKENGKFIKMAEEKFAEGPAAVRKEFEQLFTKEGIYSQAEINSKLEDVDKKLDTAVEYFKGNDIRENVGSTGTGANGKYTTIRYLDPNGNVKTGYVSKDNKTYKDKDLTERIDTGSIVPGSNGKAWKLNDSNEVGEKYNLTEDEKRKLGISSNNSSNINTNTNTNKQSSYNGYNANTNWLNEKKYLESLIAKGGGSKIWAEPQLKKLIEAKIYYTGKAFKKGGLVDFTGPAWVDGTSSNPEAFLNAQDTRNFTELKQILSSLLRADRFAGFDLSNLQGGDCNIYVTVDQIASDYDIDEAVARIKEEIMSGSSYRNINLVNRRR